MDNGKKTVASLDRDPGLPPRVEALRRVATALGDPRRCQLLHELCLAPRAVHELVERTGLRQPLVSHHLAVLRRAGFVRDVPDGRLRRYLLEADPPFEVRILLELFRSVAEQPRQSAPAGVLEDRARTDLPTSGLEERSALSSVTHRFGSPQGPSAVSDSRPARSELEDYLL